MGFTHVQGNRGIAGSTTTVSVVLAAAPTQGNLVVATLIVGAGSGFTIQDSNSNVYTFTPKSPFTANTIRYLCAYILSAPANASATITATWTGAGTPTMYADEFDSAGTASFDVDQTGTGTAGTTINTPTITPTNANELLYAHAFTTTTITAPAADATLGVWTGNHGDIHINTQAEYDLSASAATAVQFTEGSAGTWGAIAAAFMENPAANPDLTPGSPVAYQSWGAWTR